MFNWEKKKRITLAGRSGVLLDKIPRLEPWMSSTGRLSPFPYLPSSLPTNLQP